LLRSASYPWVFRVTQNPLGGLLRSRPHALSVVRHCCRSFCGPGLGADFRGLPLPSASLSTSRFPWLGRESDDAALSRCAGVIRRRTRYARNPCPIQAGTVPPGRLHSSTGLPYLVGQLRSLETCARAPSGSLRGLPGASFGHAFLPSREILSRSLSTSRSLRSGMGLSEPHFRSATDNRLSVVAWNSYRKLSFAANSGMSATPGPLYGGPEPPGRRSPLTRPRLLSGTPDCSRTFFGPPVRLWFQRLPTAFPKVAFHLTVPRALLRV